MDPTAGVPGKSAKRSAAHIPPAAFIHPLDRDALDALKALPGFDDVARAVMKHTLDKPLHVLNVASRIRVGPTQFKELHDIFLDCVERAGLASVPALYVENGNINAYTSGVDQPFVVITSAAVTRCTRPELETILAHELGHIRCEHVLYRQLASYLPLLADRLPMVGPFLRLGLELTLLEWARKAEFSCDRMGLLVSQDLEASCRVLMKVSGAPPLFYESMNVEAFLDQYKDYAELDNDNLSFVYKLLSVSRMSHPWSVVRAAELHKWVASGEYERLLSAEPGSLVAKANEGAPPPADENAQVAAAVPPPVAGPPAASIEQAVEEAVREGSKLVKDFFKKFV